MINRNILHMAKGSIIENGIEDKSYENKDIL